jgi:hypothetical protein
MVFLLLVYSELFGLFSSALPANSRASDIALLIALSFSFSLSLE